MPAKNTIRTFVKDGIYHVYNRGVEKRKIFLDKQDYRIFNYYLKTYLTAPSIGGDSPRIVLRLGREFDLYKNLELMCYALMPNHFHFLLKQNSENAVTEFMKRLTNAYVKYFNDKYDRVGTLFQGRYRAILVDKDEYLTHLSSYIHINPIEMKEFSDAEKLKKYTFSSYLDYIGKRNTPWVHRDFILNYFEKDKFSDYEEQTKKLIFASDKYKKKLNFFLLD